jgi:4-amino-4-deoxy-L-arabinose transferase-like glycosyltransferase
MKFTLYGVPQWAKRKYTRLKSGSVGDTLWKLFVLVVIAAVGVGLMATGPVGYLVGGLLITMLVSEDIRALVSDIWNRRWAEAELPI